MYERYFDAVDGILRKVRDANRESIPRAASLMADTIAADGIIHAFGSGHSQLLAIELAGRAGGLAAMQVILDPGQGKAESIEGYAATLLRDYQLESRDCLIVISNSGRNPSPIEMAQLHPENRGLDGQALESSAQNWSKTEWINFGGDKTWPSPDADWPKYTRRNGWRPPPAASAPWDRPACPSPTWSSTGEPCTCRGTAGCRSLRRCLASDRL